MAEVHVFSDESLVRVQFLHHDGFGGRATYAWHVWGPDRLLATGTDLRAGIGLADTERVILAVLLGFLEAAAEHYAHKCMRLTGSEYEPHFDLVTDEWAYLHSDEIGWARMEIEQEGRS
jgi:hypothetical protein